MVVSSVRIWREEVVTHHGDPWIFALIPNSPSKPMAVRQKWSPTLGAPAPQKTLKRARKGMGVAMKGCWSKGWGKSKVLVEHR